MLSNVIFKPFTNFTNLLNKKLQNIYKNSILYEKKISRFLNKDFHYKPSPHLLSSLIKYQNKKYKIEDLRFSSIWKKKEKSKEYQKLNNFFWFFSLDLKSSKTNAEKLLATPKSAACVVELAKASAITALNFLFFSSELVIFSLKMKKCIKGTKLKSFV